LLSPSNVEVADVLGVSDAAVSRFRSGSRVPRMPTQTLIAEKFGWSLADQAQAHSAGTWAEGFERAICRAV
jgi:predicted transcriptional regulator